MLSSSRQVLPVVLPGLALGGARYTTEVKISTGIDGWLGGDFEFSHTRLRNWVTSVGALGTLVNPWLAR